MGISREFELYKKASASRICRGHNLYDSAGEFRASQSVNAYSCGLSNAHQMYVALVDGDFQPVIARVFESEDRHAGRSQRSRISLSLRHQAREWCANPRVSERGPSLCQSSICL